MVGWYTLLLLRWECGWCVRHIGFGSLRPPERCFRVSQYRQLPGLNFHFINKPHAAFPFSCMQRKGHPTLYPKSGLHQGLYDPGTFKLDDLESIKTVFAKSISTLFTIHMQHFPFPAYREKGTPSVDPKREWHQGVCVCVWPGAFKLDHLQSMNPISRLGEGPIKRRRRYNIGDDRRRGRTEWATHWMQCYLGLTKMTVDPLSVCLSVCHLRLAVCLSSSSSSSLSTYCSCSSSQPKGSTGFNYSTASWRTDADGRTDGRTDEEREGERERDTEGQTHRTKIDQTHATRNIIREQWELTRPDDGRTGSNHFRGKKYCKCTFIQYVRIKESTEFMWQCWPTTSIGLDTAQRFIPCTMNENRFQLQLMEDNLLQRKLRKWVRSIKVKLYSN